MAQAALNQALRMPQEVPFFSGVRRQDLAALAAACRPRHFRRNEIIFQQGDPGDALHVVQAGQVRIVLLPPKGQEITLALLAAGDFFGELSLLDGFPRPQRLWPPCPPPSSRRRSD